ncbi:MAG TPA: hypothetical protein VMT89_17255, partial [Candidatus Acidoferrales bacterium]|nr:hypothetical protein [Candidatus Acidoferrales bacterium]
NAGLYSHCGGDDWFLVAGQLPPGISLISDGVLRGTPILPGVYFFTVEVVDYDHAGFVDDTAFGGLSLTVVGAPPTPTASVTATSRCPTVTPTPPAQSPTPCQGSCDPSTCQFPNLLKECDSGGCYCLSDVTPTATPEPCSDSN